MQDDLLKIKDAARLLGIDIQTLRKWSNSGKIECVILPTGHRRYKLEDINKMLNKDMSVFDGELSRSKIFIDLDNRVKKLEKEMKKNGI